MSRGVVISIVVGLAVLGLAIALSLSIESSEERTLFRLSQSLVPIDQDIEQIGTDTGRLATRFAASATMGLLGNFQALEKQQQELIQAVSEQQKSAEPSRDRIRELEDKIEQHRDQVAKHRSFTAQLVEATDLAAAAQAPAQTLMGRVQETLKESRGKLSPTEYGRLATRLTTLQTQFDRNKFFIENGLKELLASPGSDPGWTQVRTGANGLDELRPSLQELLQQIEKS